MPDREKVIAWLADEELYYRDHGDTHNSLMACNALNLLKEQEEVVRCKDCKYLEHMYTLDELNGKKCYVCRKHSFTGLREEDWFCADGERKSADEILMGKMDADPLG